MRFGITSALSAAGVVAAGVAAFTLNSAVLSSPGAGVSDDAARAAALGAVASTVPGDVTAPAGNVSVASPGSPVTANSTAISGTVTSYQVGTAGTVVIDSGNGTIRVTDVVPAAGWTSEPARTAPDGTVKVHFVRGSERVELFASLSGGKITVSVVNETPVNPSQSATPSPGQGGTPSAGNGTRPTVPRAGSDDDDDHDEDHEDEDEDHGDDHDDHEDEDDD